MYKFFYLILFLWIWSCAVTDYDFNYPVIDIRGQICISEILFAGTFEISGDTTNKHSADDFLEIKNYSKGVMDISGWVIEVYCQTYQYLVIPTGQVMEPGQCLTIAAHDDLAFRPDIHWPALNLNSSGFSIVIKDGSGSMTADYLDFRSPHHIPAGLDLSSFSSSLQRREDYFGAMDAMAEGSWENYFPSAPQNIQPGFLVYAGPGSNSHD